MQTRKRLLIWAGVINFVVAAMLIYCLVAVSFNIAGTLDMVMEFIEQSFNELTASSFLSLLKTYFIINIIADVGFGIVYIVYSRYSLEKFKRSRTSLMVLTLINILIGMSLVSIVLIVCALFGNYDVKAEEEPQQQNEKSENDAFYEMAEQITILKHKLENKQISEEEYKEQLNKIVESQTKK